MVLYFLLITVFTAVFSILAYYKTVLPLKYILLLSLTIRLLVTFVFADSLSSDIYSFLTTGHVLLSGAVTYPAMYFPFIFYLGALTLLIGKYIAPLLLLKIVFSVFDVGVTYFVYKLSKNLNAALLYAVNPVMLIIITIHGQMDSLPLFFLLWAIDTMRHKRDVATSLLLGIAIAVKPWPLIFVPFFLKRTKNPLIYILAGVIPGMTVGIHSLISHVPIMDIITPIKNYRGIYGIWGIGNIMYTLVPIFWENYIQVFRRIFLVSFAVWSFVDHQKDFLYEFFLGLLVFFVFSPLFGVQWISWIIPFIILFDSRPSLRIFLITIYVSLSLLSDITPTPLWYGPVRDTVINAISLIVWLSICHLFLSYRHTLLNSPLKKFVGYKH